MLQHIVLTSFKLQTAIQDWFTSNALQYVGVEVLEVIETQQMQHYTDGSIVVESKPLLAAPGASKFTTHGVFMMREQINGQKSCTVSAHSLHENSADYAVLHTGSWNVQHCKAAANTFSENPHTP